MNIDYIIFTFDEMNIDPLSVSLFEMRLEEIHRRDPWLRYEISIRDFLPCSHAL